MTVLPLSVVHLRAQVAFPAPMGHTARLVAGPGVRLALLAEAALVEVAIGDFVRWIPTAECSAIVPRDPLDVPGSAAREARGGARQPQPVGK